MKKRVLLLIVVVVILSLCISACTQESIATVDDPALLEFPGVKWNSSVKEVKKALNLKEGQILFDEMIEEEGQTYDTWCLVVSDIQFFGFKTERTRFIFIRYPGNDYGLLNVHIEFSDRVDMNLLRSNMIETYGEGTLEAMPQYFINEEGSLEETDSNSIVKATDAAEGYPYYWFSAINGIESLSADALERHIENALINNPNVSQETYREALRGYLEKTPAVRISCMTWTTEEASEITYYANFLVHNWQQFEE